MREYSACALNVRLDETRDKYYYEHHVTFADIIKKQTDMKLLLVLALAVLAAARPFTDEWEDFKKVHYLAYNNILNVIKYHMHSSVAMQTTKK